MNEPPRSVGTVMLIDAPGPTPSFAARYLPTATPRSPSGVSNTARGPITFPSIGEVRARAASTPLSMTSVPVVLRSVVTRAC